MTNQKKISIDLGAHNGNVHFDDASKLLDWIKTERGKWQWVASNAKAHQPTNQYWQHLNAQWQAIDKTANAYESSAEDSKSAVLEKLKNAVGTVYKTNRLIRSDSPRGAFVLGLSASDPVAAAMSASMFSGIGVSPADAKSLEGAFRALQFDSGQIGNIDAERTALSALRTEWQAEYVNLTSSIQALEGRALSLTSELESIKKGKTAELDSLKEGSSEAFDKFMSAAQIAKASIEQTYREHMALKAPVDYWRKKAEDHNSRAVRWGKAAAITGAAVLIVLAAGTWFLLLTTEKPDYWRLAVLGLFAALGIWLVRILIRLFISNLHQASDASERVTMVETFLSLMSEGHISRQEDRHLVLQALFRSTLTGLVHDEGSPPTVIDISNRLFKDK